MIDLVYCLTNLLFFDIPLLYYYINLRSSIIFCLSSGDIYLSLGISLSCSFVTVFGSFCVEFFQTIIILLGIFWNFGIALFEAVLNGFVADCLP